MPFQEKMVIASTQPGGDFFRLPQLLQTLAAADDGGAGATDQDLGRQGARVVMHGVK